MRKIRQMLVNYLFGADVSKYYDSERSFYSEFITDSDVLKTKNEQLDRAERDFKIGFCWLPNIFNITGGIATLVSGDYGFLSLNAMGEGMRLAGRYAHKFWIMKSDKMFREDRVFAQEMREGLPKLRAAGYDTKGFEQSLDRFETV